MRESSRKLAYGLAGVGAALALWWLIALVVRGGYIPAPPAVLSRFITILVPGLLRHAAASLARVGVGLFGAVITAVPLGFALGRVRRLGWLLTPVTYLAYPIPKIALLPLLMLLFGLGDAAKVAIVFLVIFFQILVSVRDAAREVPAQYVLSLRSLGGRRIDIVRFVFLPALLPSLLSAVRIGTGTALAVLFFAETFGTRAGLGYFVMESWMRIDYVDMFAGILCLGLLGLLLFLAIDAAERLFCRWQVRSGPTSR
jgi:NitT/TauT family transport system permease protein